MLETYNHYVANTEPVNCCTQSLVFVYLVCARITSRPQKFTMWGPVRAREHSRISPSRFLAKCRKSRLNQGSFVLLFFALFAFSELYLVCVLSVIFNLSSVVYFPV